MEEKYTISVSRIILRIVFQFAQKIAYTATVVSSVLFWLYSLSYVSRFKIEMDCHAVRFVFFRFSVSYTE